MSVSVTFFLFFFLALHSPAYDVTQRVDSLSSALLFSFVNMFCEYVSSIFRGCFLKVPGVKG